MSYQNSLSYKRLGLKLLDGLLMPQSLFESDKFRQAINYQPVKDDILIASYPKSGTTWMQYIVWELMNDGAQPPFVNEMWFTYGKQLELVGDGINGEINGLQESSSLRKIHNGISGGLNGIKCQSIGLGMNGLEDSSSLSLVNGINGGINNGLNGINFGTTGDESNYQRQIKTHLPFNYVPYNNLAKYIYICRNPWDVCLSYYRDVKREPALFGFEGGSFSDFVVNFVLGETAWGDYFSHVHSWYHENFLNHRENILFLTYEELKNAHRDNVIKIAKLIGQNLVKRLYLDNNLLNRIVYHTDFEYMKNLSFIIPTDESLASKGGTIDAGKNIDLIKTGEFRLKQFFNVGKSGYAKVDQDYYGLHEKQIMIERIEDEFRKMPELVNTWNRLGIHLV